jgi:hypothetical protein
MSARRDQALSDSVEADEACAAFAWLWMICSMKLYDEVALADLLAAAVVIVTLEPSA